MHDEKIKHDFHLVNPSPWPLAIAFVLFMLALGGINYMQDWGYGMTHMLVSLSLLLLCMYVWWKDVIKEAISDKAHTAIVQNGLRIGMALFIFSEVMFFVVFFWSLFRAWLDPSFILDNFWPVEEGSWPPEDIETFNPWGLPYINTLILLLSGTTVTWAHYSLINEHGKDTYKALVITVILGVIFTLLQAFEYSHAAFAFNEEGFASIYSSNFYMATGFHGVHVIIGTIFLWVCALRAKKGHFKGKSSHLGFEFAAWYWHFVDVVWLFLFAFLYVFSS